MSITRLKPTYVKSALEKLKKSKSGNYLDFSKNDLLLVNFLLACTQGDVRTVKRFLDAGANPNEFRSDSKSPKGTPLFNACLMHKNTSITATLENQIKVVNLLIAKKADINVMVADKAPLHLASAIGNIELVSILIEGKADVDISDSRGFTAAHAVIGGLGSVDLAKNVIGTKQNLVEKILALPIGEKNNPLIAQLLIEKKANIETVDATGRTLFAGACFFNQLDVAEVLRKAGADINKEDKNGKTPLMHAKEKKNEEVVKYLLAHKATLQEVKEPSSKGDAKTHINIGAEDLAEFSKATILFDDTANKLLKSVKELINACNSGGASGLKKLKELREAGLADAFEKEGLNINSWLPCPSRRTALFIACESKDHSPYNLALVKELVNAGAKFDCLGENRNSSPLHAALVNEKHDVVDFFLQKRVTFKEDELKTAKTLLKELSQIGSQSKYNWHVSTVDQEPCVVGWKARSNEDPDILERNKAAYHRKLRLFKDHGFFGELKRASRIDGSFFSQENGKILFLCFPCRPQAQQVAEVEEIEDIELEPTNSLP